MNDPGPPTSEADPRRLGCFGRIMVGILGLSLLLAAGIIAEGLWERYRPITDADIDGACPTIVHNGAAWSDRVSRSEAKRACDEKLSDPAIREQIRQHLDEKRKW